MLVFEGYLKKDGDFWLVEIPSLNLFTQGRTKEEAYKMARAIVLDAAGNPRLKLHLSRIGDREFNLTSPDLDTLIPLLLKKQRQKAGLTVLQASQRMGSNSPNAYGVYEQGRAKPTLTKLNELLAAINKEHQITLNCA